MQPAHPTSASPHSDGESFDEWLTTPLGRYVLVREQQLFDQTLPDLFGFYALQLGAAAAPLMQTSRVTHRFTMAWDTPAQLVAEADQLPFAENQFDVVLLPHTLESQALPHEVLREAYRVLRPEGHLFLTGFNPYSMFGIKRYLGRDRRGPWGSEFISLARAKDWLTLLGFDIVAARLACFNAPTHSERSLERNEWLARAGERWWPFAGGVYFLHAVKRVAGVRLIRPDWARGSRRRRVSAPLPTRSPAPAPAPQHVATDARHARHSPHRT
ncbi:MAG: class I SAM-dependent methyltransferase [Burkholderiales bacterium]|nr:class I SAM-dependent methyltransferase [Burkholderiales bacterium]